MYETHRKPKKGDAQKQNNSILLVPFIPMKDKTHMI